MSADAEQAIRPGLYVGLISGTSMDGVDAALVRLGPEETTTIASLTAAYPHDLAVRLTDIVASARPVSVHEIATLHIETGLRFAAAANELLRIAGITSRDVRAIGSHGQTLRHSPGSKPAYSWQLGDAATIAAHCGITTVADFRSIDIAYGGEGAPLVPSFHAHLFRTPVEDRVVVNIGGIANITNLAGDSTRPVSGYDTGPGNCLMDAWCAKHRGAAFDRDGEWAASGKVSESLLRSFLEDPYLKRPPPKSTGRETFNLDYVESRLRVSGNSALAPQDVQATLLAFTAESIAAEVRRAGDLHPTRLYVCGGGVHNVALLNAIGERLPGIEVASTAIAGIDPDMVEACTFAWLAAMRLDLRPVTLSTAAAERALILGGVFEPRANS